jgi:predicted transcriptional regulator
MPIAKSSRPSARQRRLLEELVALSVEIQEQRRRVDALVAKRHASYQRLFDAGIPVGIIAREIGVTPWAVRQHLRTVPVRVVESTVEDASSGSGETVRDSESVSG